ncbi:MAG: M20/M25/M40 family metallo-hydrolase [Candidatus Heimdallarchaeota archaeon]|nr:MAG: M20/M25/M40 family metallo-hydrolase [Candidatus Heimdallarchaeota archaeon]
METSTLLRELIQFKTINDPAKDIRPDPSILDYIQKIVQDWNANIRAQKFEDQGYYSIYLAPTKKIVDILFMGHLDVVPVSDGWTSDPFTLRIDSETGLGYGRGAKDCKGSIISALLMYKNLCKEKNPLSNQIGFYFSLDEETGGQYGAKTFFEYLNKHNLKPRYVINVDGGSQVVYKRRAGFGVKITLPPKIITTSGQLQKHKCHTRILGDDNRHSAYFVRGSDTHALVVLSKLLHLHRDWMVKGIDGPWVKGNVIPDYVEAEIVTQTKELGSPQITFDENLTLTLRKVRSLILINVPTELPSEFGLTINPNIVSYSAETDGTEIYFDVRAFLSSEKTPVLIKAFKQCLGELAHEAKVTCPGSSGYFHTPRDNPLVKIATEVLGEFSLPSEPCEQEGASDARYTSGIPVIDLGPRGGAIHGSDEFIDLESMNRFASIYEEIVSRLLSS